MNSILRKLLGIFGIGASWGIVWGAFFFVLGAVAGIVRPQDIDPGEAPPLVLGTGVFVGFVSGALFGTIIAVAEIGKSISDLALVRIALWGMIAAAVWPLLTHVHDSMVFILSPLGAACAVGAVLLARKSSGIARRLLAPSLEAVSSGIT